MLPADVAGASAHGADLPHLSVEPRRSCDPRTQRTEPRCDRRPTLRVESLRRIQLMPKPNYQQVRKQKERARKARQEEKQQRRSARVDAPSDATVADSAADAPASVEPASGPTT